MDYSKLQTNTIRLLLISLFMIDEETTLQVQLFEYNRNYCSRGLLLTKYFHTRYCFLFVYWFLGLSQ